MQPEERKVDIEVRPWFELHQMQEGSSESQFSKGPYSEIAFRIEVDPAPGAGQASHQYRRDLVE